MSLEKKKLIKSIVKRFLIIEKTPKSISEILDFPPSILKECGEKEVELLKSKKIKTVKDLLKIDKKDLDSLANELSIPSDQLQKWALAARLISRAWENRSKFLKREDQKIAVMGLDNAGKTSMLESLSGKTNLGEIVDLDPTHGVDIRKIESETFNLVVWDFGGQIDHRNDYFQSPEEYFLQIDLLIFVLDMQDQARYDEAYAYFSRIIDILLYFNETPYVLIFQHKSDPDVNSKPEFQAKLNAIRTKFSAFLSDKKMSFDILETSIYNFYAAEPEFAKTFKKYFSKKDAVLNVEDSMRGILETLMNMSKTMLEYLKDIKQSLHGGTISPPPSLPNDLKSPPDLGLDIKKKESTKKSQDKDRDLIQDSIMTQLKAMKKGSNSNTDEVSPSSGNIPKIDSTPNTSPSINTAVPPHAPTGTISPPPPPPPPMKGNSQARNSILANRMGLMNELKEVLKKRSLMSE
jgi:small GTP-binding protein